MSSLNKDENIDALFVKCVTLIAIVTIIAYVCYTIITFQKGCVSSAGMVPVNGTARCDHSDHELKIKEGSSFYICECKK